MEKCEITVEFYQREELIWLVFMGVYGGILGCLEGTCMYLVSHPRLCDKENPRCQDFILFGEESVLHFHKLRVNYLQCQVLGQCPAAGHESRHLSKRTLEDKHNRVHGLVDVDV